MKIEPNEIQFDWPDGFTHVAYFCPVCGTIWARSGGDPLRYYAYHALCPKHPWPDSPLADLPGDLFLPFENSYNEAIAPLARQLLNLLWAKSHEPIARFSTNPSIGYYTLTPNPASSPEDPSSWWNWNGEDSQLENSP